MRVTDQSETDRIAGGQQRLRVLGRVRLSRSTDESTSAERQREIIEQWAQLNDHEIVGWAEDIDVSGAVDPWDTPGLGPWLDPVKAAEWDIICAWKLDRLSRRAVSMHKLFGWCEDQGKTLVCISDNIDLSTWVGRRPAGGVCDCWRRRGGARSYPGAARSGPGRSCAL